MVRAFAHGTMGRRIDPSWGGHIELFLVPASAPSFLPFWGMCDTLYLTSSLLMHFCYTVC